MDEQRPWHRLFGLSWIDFFHGLPVTVEVEVDLSLKQQWLDVVIVRPDLTPLPRRMPDGFEELALHNLITFKSYQEALDGWVLHELCGHYANYRKQASPSMQNLLPEDHFRLFAVSVRYPQKLAQQVTLIPVRPGVYDVAHFAGFFRLVVVHELPREEQNAMFLLFSAREDLVQYGADHYSPRSTETTTLLRQLYERYRQEGVSMPYTMEEFIGQSIDELMKTHPDEVAKRLPADVITRVPAEKRLEGLSAEKRVEGLSPEERLKDIPVETLEAILKKRKEQGSSSDPK